MHGKQFSSTYQPTIRNGGRKPSKLKRFIKENNISHDDVKAMLKNVLFSYSEEKLKEIFSDPKQPMIIRLFIRAFLQDLKKGSLSNFETMMDRAFGKPDQNISHSGNMGIGIMQLSKEEREEKINELIQKFTENKKKKEEKDETTEDGVDKKADNN